MPISKKHREEMASKLVKDEADAIEQQIEAYIVKKASIEQLEPVIEIIFTSEWPTRRAIRNEIVKRYKGAGYSVNDYTNTEDPDAQFRLGLG